MTLVVAILGAACSGAGGDSESAEPDAFDPDTASLTRLIFWDEFSFGLALERAPGIKTLFQELLASDSPAAVPYLTDLAILPNTYTDEALEALQTRFDSPFARNVYEIHGLFQARDLVDDSDSYLVFKQKLYALVQPAYRDFLDPQQRRTISAQEVAWGSVAVDGIPPLESPRFVTADVAQDWMNPRDDVIGVVVDGDARAYPIRIIVPSGC